MTKFILNRSIPIEFHRRCIPLLVCWLMFSPFCSGAELLLGPEYEVKTGFIFNFANFVNWPEEAFENSENSLLFCFISDHPAANVLFKLNGQSIRNRQLRVEKVESGLSTKNCQMLFLGTDNEPFIRESLATIRDQHVLTIGEIEGFLQMGGVINFYDESNKLRFEVNIDAANRANLKLGAQILQSAQRIVKETEEDRQEQRIEVEKLQRKLNRIKEKSQKIKPIAPANTSKQITPGDQPDNAESNVPSAETQQQEKLDGEETDGQPEQLENSDQEEQPGVGEQPQEPEDSESEEQPRVEEQDGKVGQ